MDELLSPLAEARAHAQAERELTCNALPPCSVCGRVGLTDESPSCRLYECPRSSHLPK